MPHLMQNQIDLTRAEAEQTLELVHPDPLGLVWLLSERLGSKA